MITSFYKEIAQRLSRYLQNELHGLIEVCEMTKAVNIIFETDNFQAPLSLVEAKDEGDDWLMEICGSAHMV